MAGMNLALVLDFAGVRLNYERAEEAHVVLDFKCTGPGEKRFVVSVENGVLTYSSEFEMDATDLYPYKQPDCTLEARERVVKELLQGKFTGQDLVALVNKGEAKVAGDLGKLAELKSYFDEFQLMFPIVEP